MRPAVVVALSAVALAQGACASRTVVNRQVGEVSQRVDGLSRDVELTQARVREHEARLAEAEGGVADARTSATNAMARAEAAQRATSHRPSLSLTLYGVMFRPGRVALSAQAQALLDEALRPLVASNKGVYLEIEGHTDDRGPASLNSRLGEERAEAVRHYLHERHGIALARMALISYGETRPQAPNDSAEHRAANRRVVVNVLE